MRVAVTTSIDGAARPSAALAAEGLDPVALPCIEVAPSPARVLAEVRARAARSDLIVVTSPRAVRAVWGEERMPPVPVAAVGRATAAAVREAGGWVQLAGTAGARRLTGLLQPSVGGKKILFPHGDLSGPALVAGLRAAGAAVTAIVAYRTRPVAPGADPVDAAVFGSPSAVAGWCSARTLEGLVPAAIGPTTAAALCDRGHPDVILPDRPDYGRLAAALAAFDRERRSA